MGAPDPTEIAFRKAAIRLIPRGDSLLVAVSGGADSVALLYLLARLAPSRRWTLTVAHLDHALRRGSPADRRFVELLAASLGLPCRTDRRSVADLRRRDESPEEAARRVRRHFLLETAARAECRAVVLGHTLDDQAETILLRLARGAGPSAAAGMRASGPGPFVRPLLGISREELRAFLRRRGIRFREDPSNRSERFDRNRLRRRVLPVLRDVINPRAAEHLAAFGARLREDSEHLDRLGAAALKRVTSGEAAGSLRLEARRLAALPAPIGKRVARLALERCGSDPRRVTSRHVDALLSLASGPGGKIVALGGGLHARRRGREVVLEASP